MYELPTSVELSNGNKYDIRNKGDYRIVLDVFDVLNDSELSEQEKIVSALFIFYNCFDDVYQILQCSDIEELYKEMFNFFNAKDNSGAHCQHKMIDWKQDETLIVSAINNIARTEIRALPYLHWWTFVGYYLSIGECSLSMVVTIRDKLYNHKKLEKWEQEFRKNNPNYFKFVTEDEEATEMLHSIWNKE